ncbi:MAG: flagellar basal body P-ring formation chaperone FlgA [Desulfovibrionaceae bacterium]
MQGFLKQMTRQKRLLPTAGAALVLLAVWLVGAALAAGADGTAHGAWRLRIRDAAVVHGPRVLLGDIAVPAGALGQEQWASMAGMELWQSPPASDKPMVMTRDKLEAALRHYLGEKAALCVLPGRLLLQRGGVALDAAALQRLVVNTLTPLLTGVEGEVKLREFHVPDILFLQDATNTLTVEAVTTPGPGRLSLRLVEAGIDGGTRRSTTASVFVDVWRAMPAAAKPLNRGDVLQPDNVTYVRQNMAFLRGEAWDGRGGPWRMVRPVGTGQVVTMDAIEPQPVVSKGDAVTLMFEGRHVRLQVAAEALDDGGTGQAILVRNLQSKREVYARVRDAGTVVVQ